MLNTNQYKTKTIGRNNKNSIELNNIKNPNHTANIYFIKYIMKSLRELVKNFHIIDFSNCYTLLYIYNMPFNPETAKAGGQKSKRGPSKLLDPNIKEKMEILYEGVLDHLIMHQEDLSMSDRVKLLQSLSNYLLPKTKPVRDDITLEKLEERNNLGIMERGQDPTK